MAMLRWLARRRGPVGAVVTLWVCLRARSGREAVGRRYVDALLVVMTAGHGGYARRRATLAAERLWSGDAAHRGWIWDWIWRRPDRYCLYETDLLPSFGRFLLAPDPAATYEPRVRMVAGMSLPGDHAAIVRGMAALAVLARDDDLRAGALRVLSTTGDPRILAGLEAAFVRALRIGFWFGTSGLDDEEFEREELLRPLWWDDGSPSPLLTAVLANPHLPLPVGCRARPDRELVVLAALRGRHDLVAGFDTHETASLLLQVGSGRRVRAAAEAALCSVGPGPIREQVCRVAMAGDGLALDVVRKAGHLPADPDTHPLFLFMTRQWDRLDALDPNRERLRRYADALGPDDPERDRLCAVAGESGHRTPCEPTRRSGFPGRPSHPAASPPAPADTSRPGISGSGRYTDAGGGFSVHGV